MRKRFSSPVAMAAVKELERGGGGSEIQNVHNGLNTNIYLINFCYGLVRFTACRMGNKKQNGVWWGTYCLCLYTHKKLTIKL